MHNLLYNNIFVKDVQVYALATVLAYTSVLLDLFILVSSSVGGGDSDFCGSVSPSVLSGDCHVISCSSSLFTFFLLKKPNFIYRKYEINYWCNKK